jgi:NTE family protein
VSGVSIGAINSAIIAGNSRRRRLDRLRTFWQLITDRKIWSYTPDGDAFRKARNVASSWMTMMKGQPGFFSPRNPNPWLSIPGAQSATSYYDSAPLRETLEDLVDFSMINERAVRFSVGAVNVLSGNFVYFDNATEIIGPEHVMASGALPPALPMIKIGTDHFWDGGIVSNTPPQHILDQDDRINTLIFQIDLFSARGVLPRDIRTCSRATRTSCIPRAPATTPTCSGAFTPGKSGSISLWTRSRKIGFPTRSASSRKSSPTCRRSPSCR